MFFLLPLNRVTLKKKVCSARECKVFRQNSIQVDGQNQIVCIYDTEQIYFRCKENWVGVNVALQTTTMSNSSGKEKITTTNQTDEIYWNSIEKIVKYFGNLRAAKVTLR